MSRRRVRLGGAAVLLTAALITAGCSTSSTPDGQAQEGGTLTVAAAQGIPQLNPAIRTFAWEEVLFPLLWNGLTKTDESGEIVGDLDAVRPSGRQNDEAWHVKPGWRTAPAALRKPDPPERLDRCPVRP